MLRPALPNRSEPAGRSTKALEVAPQARSPLVSPHSFQRFNQVLSLTYFLHQPLVYPSSLCDPLPSLLRASSGRSVISAGMAGIAPPFQVPKVHISSHFSPPRRAPGAETRSKERRVGKERISQCLPNNKKKSREHSRK